MAESKTPLPNNPTPVQDDLESADIELRNPTVVLSVRLDDATARVLHRIAQTRGVRISEVLRQAALAYATTGAPQEVPAIEITGGKEPAHQDLARLGRFTTTSNDPSRRSEPYRRLFDSLNPNWAGREPQVVRS